MILVSFYQPETGEIAMTSSVDDESQIAAAEIQIGLPSVRNDALVQGYVRGTQVVAFPERPSPLHVFNYATEAWEDGSLVERKAQRWSAIKARRQELEASGFPYLGKLVDSDTVSQQRITTHSQAAQAALAAGEPYSIDWICMDNTLLTLDAAAMVGMQLALANWSTALHQTAQQLRARIDAAETAQAVDAVTWPT